MNDFRDLCSNIIRHALRGVTRRSSHFKARSRSWILENHLLHALLIRTQSTERFLPLWHIFNILSVIETRQKFFVRFHLFILVRRNWKALKILEQTCWKHFRIFSEVQGQIMHLAWRGRVDSCGEYLLWTQLRWWCHQRWKASRSKIKKIVQNIFHLLTDFLPRKNFCRSHLRHDFNGEILETQWKNKWFTKAALKYYHFLYKTSAYGKIFCCSQRRDGLIFQKLVPRTKVEGRMKIF